MFDRAAAKRTAAKLRLRPTLTTPIF